MRCSNTGAFRRTGVAGCRLQRSPITMNGSMGLSLWIVDAHRDDGKRYVVRSEEMLSAFLELERITHELAVSSLLGDDSN
jgi:hypothetical protein